MHARNVGADRLALAVVCAIFFGLARAQSPEETLARADVSEPLALMQAAVHLERAGKKDEAMFWFYAGQLRARYSPRLRGENSQLVLIFTTAGEPINAHAQKDILEMEKTVQRVLEWDEKTFAAWAKAYRLDPSDAKLAADRAKSREGLVALMAELKSKREHYEKLAREYKNPLDEHRAQQQEYARQIRHNFSTRTVERVVAGQTLRLPVNYFSRTGAKQPDKREVADLTLTVFLPQFEGFTIDTPLEFGGMRNVMWVGVNDRNMHRDAARLFEAFITTNPKIKRIFGSEAFYFDAYKNPAKARLPLHGYMDEYVFTLDRPGRERTYMSCSAPRPGIDDPNPRCRLFMRHAPSGLRLSVNFSQDFGNDWRRIADQTNALLDAWHAAKP